MSHPHEPDHGIGSDTAAVTPTPISPELAEEVEDVLRAFAEEAELTIALIVSRDASLVAGISSEENIEVDEISTLVASASTAVKSLIHELGEIGAIESLHQGSERLVYLHDLLGRFILVGVSDSGLPAGIIRQQAVPIRASLSELLKDVADAEDDTESPTGQVQRSLRITGMLQELRKKGDVDEQVGSEQPAESDVTDETPKAEGKPVAVEEVLDEPESVTTVTDDHESKAEETTESSDVTDVESPQLENEEVIQDEEKKPSRPATIVIDSPFEEVTEQEEQEEEEMGQEEEEEQEEAPSISDNWGGEVGEIEIVGESEPNTPHESQAEENPEASEDAPEAEAVVVDEKNEVPEVSEEPPPRKSGPRYSFELG